MLLRYIRSMTIRNVIKTGEHDMTLANDNVIAESKHHAECLRLIQDLHDLLRCAEKVNLRFEDTSENIEFAYDWKYWADECADVLRFSR